MKPPRGVLKPGEEGKVCRLVKGLYGLKQAGRGWYQEMSWVLVKDLGFTCSAVDHSVFFRRSSNEHTIIAVATDDMVVTSKRAEDITRFKIRARTSKRWSTSLGLQIPHLWQPQWSLAQHFRLPTHHRLQRKSRACAEYLMQKRSAASFGQSSYLDQMQLLLCPPYRSSYRTPDPLTRKRLSA